MRELCDLLAECREICENPGAQLKKALSGGRKVIGVMPYFCPEELVYAAGMLPFGLWGAQMQTSESKRYFPAFICSILQTTLEMGIRGQLNGLSAVMIPICCDSLKSMGTNWEYGVPEIPVINVAYAQNRKIQAGVEFTVSQLRKIRARLEEIAGKPIRDEELRDAVRVYNENRAAILSFSAAAGAHPEALGPAARSDVIKAGYFMDRAEHTRILKEITAALESLPQTEWKGLRVVTTGILADAQELLKIFEENGICIVADQVEHESVGCTQTPVTEDPLTGMAERLADTEGSSVLFDPTKQRGRQLVELAKKTGADGVIWIMTKFCDPEEFDYVPVKHMLDRAGIRLLAIEADQQMVSYGQIRSAVQAFTELLG